MKTRDRREFLKEAATALIVAELATSSRAAFAQATGGKLKPSATDVLLVIDVQNCFVPGGTLPVKEGDAIVPLINRIGKGFAHVVLTQDWHTPGHASWTFSSLGQEECARFVADRKIPLTRLLTHRFRLDQAAEAYRLFDTQTTGKGVFVP